MVPNKHRWKANNDWNTWNETSIKQSDCRNEWMREKRREIRERRVISYKGQWEEEGLQVWHSWCLEGWQGLRWLNQQPSQSKRDANCRLVATQRWEWSIAPPSVSSSLSSPRSWTAWRDHQGTKFPSTPSSVSPRILSGSRNSPHERDHHDHYRHGCDYQLPCYQDYPW